MSLIRKYTSRAMAGVHHHQGDLASVGIEAVESGATGAAVAFVGSKVSLDAMSGKVPLDAAAGAAGLALCAFMPVPHVVKRAADRLFAIGMFRMASKHFPSKAGVHGEIEDGMAYSGIGAETDPILAAAAAL